MARSASLVCSSPQAPACARSPDWTEEQVQANVKEIFMHAREGRILKLAQSTKRLRRPPIASLTGGSISV